MAKYLLCNRVVVDGIELKSAKEIDDGQYDVAKIAASGGILVLLPNAVVEARAAKVRGQQAKGWRDDESDLMSAAHAEDSSGGGGGVSSVTASSPLASSGGANPNISFASAITDLIHGNRAGGALHALADGSTAGFMSAAQYNQLLTLSSLYVQPMVVFRPGVPSSGNHVATWAEVEGFVNTVDVPATVFVDSTIAPAVVPAATNLDCKGQITFAPNTFGIAGVNFLDFEDGATLRRPYGVRGPLYLRGAPTVDPMVTIEDVQKAFSLREGAGFVMQAGSLVSPIRTTADFTEVVMFEGAIYDNTAAPTIAMIDVDSALNLFVFAAVNLIAFNLSSTVVSGGGGSTTLLAITDGATSFPDQPGFAGITSRLRYVQAANIEPSAGNSSSHPANPRPGQMYFDTDQNRPQWWTGSAWIAVRAPNQITFKAGVASADDHVATWAEVAVLIAATGGHLTVVVDDSVADCHVPAGTDTNCLGLVKFTSPVKSGLTIEDTAILRNPSGVSGNLKIGGVFTTQSGIVFDINEVFFTIREIAEVVTGAGSTLPAIEVAAGVSVGILIREGGSLTNSMAPTIPVVGLDTGGAGAFVIASAGLGTPFNDHAFSGDGTTSLTYIGDASCPYVSQVLFAGTLATPRSDQGYWVQPLSTTTAGRPTLSLQVGDQDFDTDLGIPIWWDGTQWISAAGLPV